MAQDDVIQQHRAWIGALQPVGLVVAPSALKAAGAVLHQDVSDERAVLQDLCGWRKDIDRTHCVLRDFRSLAKELFHWRERDLLAPPDSLTVRVTEFGEELKADGAVAPRTSSDPDRWVLLYKRVPDGRDFDKVPDEASDSERWNASPQSKFERLLRESNVPIGLLDNGLALRLVYAPRSETSGHLTFPYFELCRPGDRHLLPALLLLLNSARLHSLPPHQRLDALLASSRRFQNEVSEKLAGQVFEALELLLSGFQRAAATDPKRALETSFDDDPKNVYGGLLSVILRLVFLLYAEERSLMPSGGGAADPYEHLSVATLHRKLVDDKGRFPDTMGQRYGAWTRLLVLFRLVFDGASHGSFALPARHGALFNPDRYPFLEGRLPNAARTEHERLDPPAISDEVVRAVLDKLVMLDGDRISFRALDVEQLGSVYERMMGFDLERADGPMIVVESSGFKVSAEAILAQKPRERAGWFSSVYGIKLPKARAAAVATATTVDQLVTAFAALNKQGAIEPEVLYLQPSDERRRSGSHYTPRELTEPIVRAALAPVLQRLGPRVTPEALLELAVCDPAMGSGAFLVEACRQLGAALVKAWELHGRPTGLAPEEDIHVHALRLVAQRCLYGVDRNLFAVELARLSLWLVTLAKALPFTFVDHALRHGDSVLGLLDGQLRAFRWKLEPRQTGTLLDDRIAQGVDEARTARQRILALAGESDDGEKRELLGAADDAVRDARRIGDLVVHAFFSSEKDQEREAERGRLLIAVNNALAAGGELPAPLRELAASVREPTPDSDGLAPFHWTLEFPEVFARGGFDVIVGNPPFAGKNTIADGNRRGYPAWLVAANPRAHGNSDLVAYFFRRAFDVLRPEGTAGLIATNTIAQGDTRATGLYWLRKRGADIYRAITRYVWPVPGAAVIVSQVHFIKGRWSGARELDGRKVDRITAFLFHAGGDDDPHTLVENQNKSFQGAVILGMGFTFDDANDGATPLRVMDELVEKDPRNKERIFPYLGGEELNSDPTQSHRRYVINFGTLSMSEAEQWPDLFQIVQTKVKPERLRQKDRGAKERWWQFIRPRPELAAAVRELSHVLVCSRVSSHLAFARLPVGPVFAETLVVITRSDWASFAVLQSRVHEVWTRFLSSSMKDDLRYTPSTCFETFPFPVKLEENVVLAGLGKRYHEARAAWMKRNDRGLTELYNAFHNESSVDESVIELRTLHAEMDRAVLDAYGWTSVQAGAVFGLVTGGEDEEGTPKARSIRLHWPAATRDDVLARLADENLRREAVAGEQSDDEDIELALEEDAPRSPKKAAKKGRAPKAKQPPLVE
jgi:hypothetical protein